MDVLTKRTQENQIFIIPSPLGIIIGRVAEGEIIDPRVLVIERKGNSALNITFHTLIGNPHIFDKGGLCSYSVEDQQLNALYIEEVTGIKLATVVPKDNVITLH